jgi:hypothetical protein
VRAARPLATRLGLPEPRVAARMAQEMVRVLGLS